MSDQSAREFLLLPDDEPPPAEHEPWFEADLELAALADLLERKALVPHQREEWIWGVCLSDLEIEELGEEYESEFEVDPWLTARFQLYNQRFLGGRLPPCVVRRGPLLRLYGLRGYCDRVRRTILLEDDLSETVLDWVLIHEMCHAKTGAGHGARFRAELARIASMGCVSAARALARLEPNPVNIRRALRVLAKDNPHRPWRVIRVKLAANFRLSVGELRRLAPWAQKEWYRLRSKVRPKATHQERTAGPPKTARQTALR